MKNILKHCASMKNPPKGYGSISVGMEAAAYRSKRLDYWKKQLKANGYTPECFEKAEADVVAKYGNPF